jgi:membrane protein implicated in regulation of membrane protease activity
MASKISRLGSALMLAPILIVSICYVIIFGEIAGFWEISNSLLEILLWTTYLNYVIALIAIIISLAIGIRNVYRKKTK